MTVKSILEMLRYGERINLECKEAKSDVPKAVWETSLFICEYQRWPDFAGCQRKHRRGRFF